MSAEATKGGSIRVESMRLWKVVTVVASCDDSWLCTGGGGGGGGGGDGGHTDTVLSVGVAACAVEWALHVAWASAAVYAAEISVVVMLLLWD